MNLSDLTPSQRAAICNGCGSKGWPFGWLRPAKLCYSAACDEHDLRYFIGGTEADRRAADNALWIACLLALNAWEAERPRGWLGVRLRGIAAGIFWIAVRLGGEAAFHYGPQRTVADLPTATDLEGA